MAQACEPSLQIDRSAVDTLVYTLDLLTPRDFLQLKVVCDRVTIEVG